jgi:hypothetical protein
MERTLARKNATFFSRLSDGKTLATSTSSVAFIAITPLVFFESRQKKTAPGFGRTASVSVHLSLDQSAALVGSC